MRLIPTKQRRFKRSHLLQGLIKGVFALLFGLVISYTVLIPYAATKPPLWQYSFWQAHTLVFIGTAAILCSMLFHFRRSSRQYSWTCLILLMAHVITIYAAIADIDSYPSGIAHSIVTPSMLFYVVLYVLQTFALVAVVPFKHLPRIQLLRIGADVMLLLVLIDLALRWTLPLMMNAWLWTDTIFAVEQRLVTSIGVACWYGLISRHVKVSHDAALKAWGAGMVAMILADVVLLWATVQMANGTSRFIQGAMMPLWDVHQILWTLGLFLAGHHAITWKPRQAQVHAATHSFLGANVRQIFLILIVVLIGADILPSIQMTVWLIGALLAERFVCTMSVSNLQMLIKRLMVMFKTLKA